MSKGYYRVDAVRQDGRAGDTQYVRASSMATARTVFASEFPGVADWDLTVSRITREEFPMEPVEPDELVIPPLLDVIPLADPEEPSLEHLDAYAAWATAFIRENLLAKRAAGEVRPTLLTRYAEDDDDSRDLVTLGAHDEVSVIDAGSR